MRGMQPLLLWLVLAAQTHQMLLIFKYHEKYTGGQGCVKYSTLLVYQFPLCFAVIQQNYLH